MNMKPQNLILDINNYRKTSDTSHTSDISRAPMPTISNIFIFKEKINKNERDNQHFLIIKFYIIAGVN